MKPACSYNPRALHGLRRCREYTSSALHHMQGTAMYRYKLIMQTYTMRLQVLYGHTRKWYISATAIQVLHLKCSVTAAQYQQHTGQHNTTATAKWHSQDTTHMNRLYDITSKITCDILFSALGRNSEWAQFQYFAYGTAGELKRAGITQHEMKGEGYSKWKEVFLWISNK